MTSDCPEWNQTAILHRDYPQSGQNQDRKQLKTESTAPNSAMAIALAPWTKSNPFNAPLFVDHDKENKDWRIFDCSYTDMADDIRVSGSKRRIPNILVGR